MCCFLSAARSQGAGPMDVRQSLEEWCCCSTVAMVHLSRRREAPGKALRRPGVTSRTGKKAHRESGSANSGAGLLLYLLYSAAPIVLLIVCVVHAVRTGRIFPWIYLIIFLPLIGSLIYLGMEVLPEIMAGRRATRLGTQVRNLADPHRALREAHREAGLVGSVDSKRALAEQYMGRGRYDDARAIYNEALQGQFKEDT